MGPKMGVDTLVGNKGDIYFIHVKKMYRERCIERDV